MKITLNPSVSNVPAGEYEAVVESITEDQKFKRKVFTFLFRITEGDQAGATVKGFVNGSYKTFSRYSKLYQWYAGMMGRELDEDQPYDVDLEDFKTRVLLVKVESKTSKRTTNKFGNVAEIIKTVREL